MLDKGLRADGGIGDETEPIHFNNNNEQYLVKLMHDASFHILVKVILLNVLFGIIIDSFAELRDQKSKRDNDMVNVCFICNHPRLVFDKYCEGGFERHIAKDHNLWMYVYYMVHLYSKDTSDHTGIESMILSRFEEGDISWIPRQKALCLQSIIGEEEEDGAAEELKLQIHNWSKGIMKIEKQLSSLLDNISKKEQVELQKQKKDEKLIPA